MKKDMKYTIKSAIPPRLYQARDNKIYIMPAWIEVTSDTTMDDIEWIKPVYEPKTITSSAAVWKPELGENKYNTRFDAAANKYFCGCPGFWRAKGECKHVKALKGE
jgi:hypothetical protein